MFAYPQVLSLITTHQCTAACDHCCFKCTPKVTKAIPLERLHALVEEATEIRSIKLIAFTGGECFLLKENLDALISRANSRGLMTRCVTNGYWGISERAAEERAERLVQAGLNEINFSTGTFHSQYVAAGSIVNAAAACLKRGLTTLINVEIFNESEFQLESITEAVSLRPYIQSGALKVQRNVWIDNEGSNPLSHCPKHSRFDDERISGCTTALNVLAVTPDMSLVACCGLHLERIPDLHLGSVATSTLKQVLDAAPNDFLKIWIHVEGPERILQFVKKHKPDYDLPVHSVHPCETCLHLYSDETARTVLVDNYSKEVDRVSALFLAGVGSGHLKAQVASNALSGSAAE